jgi:NADH-quinone oxidoreductase subunit N
VSEMTFQPSMFLAILPELLLLALVGLVLLFDAIWSEDRRRNLGWLTFAGLIIVLAAGLLFGMPDANNQEAFGSMIRHDGLTLSFKLLFIFGAAITTLFVMDTEGLGKRGEFYILMLISTIGMNLMASANDLIMLYLAIETTSIPLYILAGFLRLDEKSTEAGFKYLLFGAATSTVMLYGFSLLFGLTGTTTFAGLKDYIGMAAAGQEFPVYLIGSLFLILVGFGFKISAVPFHFWAPDVYEGAPTPVAGFLSTASKAAGFIVLLRVLWIVFPSLSGVWTSIIAALSVVTMFLGNLVALAQSNVKRLLAYSSIAHAGYIMIGVVALGTLGVSSVLFYIGAYLLTNLAAFGIVVIFSKAVGSDEISAYAGLSRRSPGLALAILVAFLSLAGMPPLAGFVAKVFVFAAAVKADWIWLAVVGVINSIIGLYYYLTFLKVVYLYPLADPEDERKPIGIPRPFVLGLVILIGGIILVGTLFGPFFDWATAASLAAF